MPETPAPAAWRMPLRAQNTWSDASCFNLGVLLQVDFACSERHSTGALLLCRVAPVEFHRGSGCLRPCLRNASGMPHSMPCMAQEGRLKRK